MRQFYSIHGYYLEFQYHALIHDKLHRTYSNSQLLLLCLWENMPIGEAWKARKMCVFPKPFSTSQKNNFILSKKAKKNKNNVKNKLFPNFVTCFARLQKSIVALPRMFFLVRGFRKKRVFVFFSIVFSRVFCKAVQSNVIIQELNLITSLKIVKFLFLHKIKKVRMVGFVESSKMKKTRHKK